MPTQPFTVRTNVETIKRLDAIGKATDRSRNYIVNQALDRFVTEEAAFIAEVEAGRKDFKEGRKVSHEAVFRKLRTKINANIKTQR